MPDGRGNPVELSLGQRPLSTPHTTFSIDDRWDYTPAEKERIAQTLNDKDQLGLEQIAAAMGRISDAARQYRGRAVYENSNPFPPQAQREVSRLYRAITDFRESFASLTEQTRTKLDNLALEMDGRPIIPSIRDAFKTLGEVAFTVGLASDAGASQGKCSISRHPRFVRALAEIWADVHNGEWPTRRYDWQSRTMNGPFYDFVCACHLPVEGNAREIDDIVRAVCVMGRTGRDRG